MIDINNFDAIKIGLASSKQIRSWSSGEVTKPETINYRTLKPEKDGLFCERIFGPTKDWECYCGKYKRVRYKGIVCERCGVEVTRSKVRRERMGHVDLAAPVSHIWFFKGVPSRIGYLLDMAPKELEKVLYFAASIVTWVDDEARQKDLGKLEKEIDKTIASYEAEREERVLELKEAVERRVKYLETGDQKGFADDDLLWADTLDVNLKKLSDDERAKMEKELRKQFDADISDTEAYYEDGIERLRQTWELFQTMEPKQVIADETLFRELKDRFGSPFGWGEYFRGGMGAESVRDLLQQVDLDAEREELEDQVKTAKGQKQSRAVKRLKVVSAFIHSDNKPEDMILEAVPVIPPELRPMVQLDGGRFATSDLNDLYRRVINRNNRLKRLLDLGAPEIIVNNEKRMLQEAVDALFDNGRRGRPVTGPGNRPLKSLSDMLKGKQGRFRQNLLGKRVDYSGRSVIVAGPELQHPPVRPAQADGPRAVQAVHHGPARRAQVRPEHQGRQEDGRLDDPGGLGRPRGGHPGAPGPAQPRADAPPPGSPGVRAGARRGQGDPGAPAGVSRVQRRLRRRPDGRARAAVSRGSGRGAAADAVGEQHPVAGARRAARHAHPGHGARLVLPDLRSGRAGARRAARARAGRQVGREEARQAAARVPLGAGGRAVLRVAGRCRCTTSPSTAGATRPSTRSPPSAGSSSTSASSARSRRRSATSSTRRPTSSSTSPLRKRDMNEVIERLVEIHGPYATALVLDAFKELGFHFASQAGITISKNDVVIPPDKEEILEGYEAQVGEIQDQYDMGLITQEERKEAVVEKWTAATDEVGEAMQRNLDRLNPIYMMANSGARGSFKQIRQLAGMRGLMANPKGEIIERPIKANFMEGLTVLEYFISTHGARKGLADTALRTADSGYLTRRLVDVAQDVIVRDEDCGTKEYIEMPVLGDDGRPNGQLEGRFAAHRDQDQARPLARRRRAS